MAKRKHTTLLAEKVVDGGLTASKKLKATKTPAVTSEQPTVSIQIIAGSYDRILHGLTATISTRHDTVEFADSFLFNAHTSAIRCLAISPPSEPVPNQTQKIILASGSSDERVNLYHLSAHPPRKTSKAKIPSLSGRVTKENSSNKELGSLLHHASSVTALCFPTRSKLMSASEDSTIAVTRTRDWSLLSSIKAPIPKPQGRPSGDTAPMGGTPAGVNDFAVHPSMKLMISVGKGERCMRLWNLVTGKKAGVLNFSREMLAEVGEGKFGSGEGRKVSWGISTEGEEFCVGFDRAVLVFGMDSQPRCKVTSQNKTKLHQLYYILPTEEADSSILAASTDDGRVLFFSTATEDLVAAPAKEAREDALPSAKLVAQLGGRDAGVIGRVKDFKILNTEGDDMIVVTASSDGIVRLWSLDGTDVASHKENKPKQVGKLLATNETGNRITCLEAFVMLPLPEGLADVEELQDETPHGKLDSSSDSE